MLYKVARKLETAFVSGGAIITISSPVSIGDAILLVTKAIELYNKIKEAPEQIEKINRRMTRLRSYLGHLQDLLNDKDPQSLNKLRPDQAEDLKVIIHDVECDAERVNVLLDRWIHKIGPWGFKLQSKKISDAIYALGSSPEKLDVLAEDLEQHCIDIHRLLEVLIAFGQNVLLKGMRPTSPMPPARRDDYGIIFVEPYNQGRSRIAEAYTRLVREWTIRTGGSWMIKFVRSAGFRLRSQSDCTDILEGLRLGLAWGNKPPYPIAIDALFDNNLFNHPYKTEIKQTTLARSSRGVTKNLFSSFDYIFVFTREHQAQLLRLKEALVNKFGPSAAPEGKGRLLLLGEYGSKQNTAEIFQPDKTDDPRGDRERWNWAASRIKVSFKDFLKREFDWVEPPKGAKQR
ncbi:MAG: hypothetical protein M1820_008067 [Bogoriella megaspora]|nr:MAG: hypothetical protein M1820_008067 [Bogoriella megaspora]